MKISSVTIKNFRSYSNGITENIPELTAFVGKNDVGKSTILEALDIFFNKGKGVIKLDGSDKRKNSTDDFFSITVVFEDLPNSVVLDASNKTDLKSEYLLNKEGCLEVTKKYDCSKKVLKEEVFLNAYHPSNTDCKNLLELKNTELKSKVKALKTLSKPDLTKNANMREVIWGHYKNNLTLEEKMLEVDKEDAKKIWGKLEESLPIYFLFQSDRKNSDGDNEVQDPMKIAVKKIMADENIQQKLGEIAKEVREQLSAVAEDTLAKLKEMNPDIANELKSQIPDSTELKWADVFKNVQITSDDEIPLNKRGSGVRRLVLLNFFRAQAEKHNEEKNGPGIIYAIEEPETSQHSEHQLKLISAFKALASNNTQIFITTHSSLVVKQLEYSSIRLISTLPDSERSIKKLENQSLPYVSLNEVNYKAFHEYDPSFHNELYGHLEKQNWLQDYGQGQKRRDYKKQNQPKQNKPKPIINSEYIRHQIHHPENKINPPYTEQELKESIDAMHSFLANKTNPKSQN